MAESTKSAADVKDSISQHFQEVNTTVSNTAKDLSLLTKDLIQKESLVVQAFKDQAAQDLKQIQQNYSEKEEKVYRLLSPEKNPKPNNPGQSQAVAKEYEQILKENVSKLREIAQEDFKISNANNQKLIEETKEKLHNFVSKAFNDHTSKEEFTKTTAAIFASVNRKIRDDLELKSKDAVRTTSNLSPEYGSVFVHNVKKPPEEIEAEHLLQQLFEEQLLEFNEQVRKDFQDINCRVTKLVEETKVKLNDTLQSAKENVPQTSLEANEASIPNLPTTSAVEQNVHNLLNKAGKDFEDVKESMVNDVQRKKQKINDNAQYYAEKVLGKHFLGTDEDE